MEFSDGVKQAQLRFYDRLSAGDVSVFDELVSADDATSIVGTSPGEFVTERAQLRFGFETEGVTLTAGDPMKAYEEGDVGWAYDEPLFGFPDGSSIRIRLTTIYHRVGGAWRFLHGHFSVGVPDDEVVSLQQRWTG